MPTSTRSTVRDRGRAQWPPGARVQSGTDPPPLPLRAVIVSELRLFCEGLANILRSGDVITVAGTAGDQRGAEEIISRMDPDLVLLDVDFPEALSLVHDIRERNERASVVALGVFESADEVVACAEAGVDGYVRRDGSVADLLKVVQSVRRGEFLCPPRVAASLLRRVQLTANGIPSMPGTALTSREAETARLIAQGMSNKEIAAQLQLEVATVKNHVHNLLKKLHLQRRGQAAAWLRGQRAARLLPSQSTTQED